MHGAMSAEGNSGFEIISPIIRRLSSSIFKERRLQLTDQGKHLSSTDFVTIISHQSRLQQLLSHKSCILGIVEKLLVDALFFVAGRFELFYGSFDLDS